MRQIKPAQLDFGRTLI